MKNQGVSHYFYIKQGTTQQNYLWFLLTDDNQHEIEGKLQGNQLDLAPETHDHVWGFVDDNKIELWDHHLHHYSGKVI